MWMTELMASSTVLDEKTETGSALAMAAYTLEAR